MRKSLIIWDSKSNRVSGTHTSPDSLKRSTEDSSLPHAHIPDVPRFSETSSVRGYPLQETYNAGSSSQLYGQTDRDTQSYRPHDAQKTPDCESNSDAPKARRRRRRPRKSHLVREDVGMQETEARRGGDPIGNASRLNIRPFSPLGSGLLPFPVQPWPYYQPLMIWIPVAVVPMVAGPSGLTMTNVAGNVTNIQIYDDNSTNLRIRRGTVDPFSR